MQDMPGRGWCGVEVGVETTLFLATGRDRASLIAAAAVKLKIMHTTLTWGKKVATASPLL
jgi:hypothetical protein